MQRYLIRVTYICLDVAVIYCAIFLACLIRVKALPFTASLTGLFFDPHNPFRELFAFWVFIIVIISYMYRLYHTDRGVFEGAEVWRVFQANVLATIGIIVLAYVFKVEGLPRSIVGISFVLIILLCSLWRVAKRVFVEYLVSHGYNNFNVLIIGAGKVGRLLKDEIKRKKALGLKVVGFLDDYPQNVDAAYRDKVLAPVSDFRHVVQQYFVDQVFVTIHHNPDIVRRILVQAAKLGVAVRVVPEGYDLTDGEFRQFNIGLIPVLEYFPFALKERQLGKRVFDCVVSLCALIVFCPFFVCLALAIKLDSRGPVFYLSERFGRRGKRFHMLKFRTMVAGADQMLRDLKKENEVDGPIFKMRNDPRLTRMGRFLRKYSLDELPQLINVLKGEMSLVGPRPFPVDQLEREDVRQLRRLGVRPGITGLWQIKGRSDIPFNRLLRWDTWYINHWSFWLDLNILWQTLPAVIKGKGAY
ncbi:MAG TPA: sugar transferase [Candidatus Omnitrophota bacterium]|nr:sugar transferase [Candidatus Omnitrophota bacterium]HSA31802.1 sugar transferase [Candidatus Omnitrophota bacterium]